MNKKGLCEKVEKKKGKANYSGRGMRIKDFMVGK